MAGHSPKKSLWRTVKTIAWSFIGLGGGSAYDEEAKNLNPLHIIAVGLVGVFILVAALVMLVNWMVAR
jgi:amino acid transporter